MGSYIARQPNGLLCRFSTIVDCITHYNLTDDDYIEMCAERARNEARENLKNKHFIKPYQHVLEDTRFYNMTEKEFRKIREKMGEIIVNGDSNGNQNSTHIH